MSNKLFIAAAGSGKTNFLVKEAIRRTQGKVLVTTFTEANDAEIRRRFIKENRCIPENVTVQTWFSFLLQHGARPYQGCRFKEDIEGMVLMSEQSARGIAEADTRRHYFTSDRKIYSDKLAKFVLKCNEQSGGAVIDRLSRIYDDILIDEVQDLSGWDLDILKLLFASSSNTLLVGDPRQGTYSTSNAARNKQFAKAGIVHFFEDQSLTDLLDVDDSTLTKNYRCVPALCEISNRLYPELPSTTSENGQTTGHDGLFLVKPSDVSTYLAAYSPMQLHLKITDDRFDVRYPVTTFGKAKGMEFDRVLIYPTQPFIKWLGDHSADLKPVSRAKFYVAITRAFFSAGIVFDHSNHPELDWIPKFNPLACLGKVDIS